MKERFQGIVIGVLICTMLLCVSFAKQGSEMVERFFADIKVVLDGTELALEDASGNEVEPFIIDGTTYLPIRAISNALELNVAWDAQTQTVVLKSKKFINDEKNQQNDVAKEDNILKPHFQKIDLLKIDGEYYINNIGFSSIEYNDEGLIFIPYSHLTRLVFLGANKKKVPTWNPGDNPYFECISWGKLKYKNQPYSGYESSHRGDDGVKWLSPTESYVPRWIEFNNIKIYEFNYKIDYEKEYGIRCFGSSICINDVYKKLDINKVFAIGKYQENGMELYYLELKNAE